MQSDNRPWLVLVGGFLGAGKTTLLARAARELLQRGVKPAMILNDQEGGLVDTAWIQAQNLRAGEVTGGCFCCRFSDLVTAAADLRAFAPGVIFAEPAGSCADLAATVIAPLRQLYPERFRLAPYTVLVDPARAAEVESGKVGAELAFLFGKQIEEADLLCAAKSDLYPDFAGAPRRLSARTGAGVAAWLDEVLSGTLTAGGHCLSIDYEEYARAEAALVWLNFEACVACEPPLSPALLAGPFFDEVEAALDSVGASIAHLKVLDQCASGYVKAAVCANGAQPDVDGTLDAEPAGRHNLRLNLRATGDPSSIRALVESAAGRLPGRCEDVRLVCFRPAPPRPEHRFSGLGTRIGSPEQRRGVSE